LNSTRRVLAQGGHVLLGRAILGGRELRRAQGVEFEIARIDDHVGIRKLAEFLQLGVRERRLHRSAPAEHVDGAHPAGLERREGVGGDIRGGQVGGTGR
jgi:hypothetical protein